MYNSTNIVNHITDNTDSYHYFQHDGDFFASTASYTVPIRNLTDFFPLQPFPIIYIQHLMLLTCLHRKVS